MKHLSEIVYLFMKMPLNAASTKLDSATLIHATKVNAVTHSANETSFGSTHPLVKT